MPEHTFALIKNGARSRGKSGEISMLAERNGFQILIARLFGERDIERFAALYAEHQGKPFYTGLLDSVMPCSIGLLLEKPNAVADWRTLMGPTDPARARIEAPSSLRALFGTELPDNATHGSDSPASAAREIGIFFPSGV